jgi:Lipid A core - O-antigen ligase and related enzymes
MKKLEVLIHIFFLIPFLFVLATVFATGKNLGNGLVSGKYFWFYGAMILVVFPVLLSCFRKEIRSLRPNVMDALVLVFIACVLICSPSHSGISQKHAILPLLACLYFYFRMALNINKSAPFVLSVFFIGTGLAETLWGLSQLYGWTPSYHNLFRITGTFFNPGPYSGYVAMVFPMALYFVFRDKRIFRCPFARRLLPLYFRWGISVATVVCAVLILPAAMSRAAWIGLAGGSCLVITCCFLQNKRCHIYILQHKKKVVVFSCLALLVMCLASIGIYYLKKDSADGRALTWKISTSLIAENLAGVGLGHFPGAYGNAQAAYFADGKGTETEAYVAGNPEYAFNEYLQVCIELGVLPFVLFLAMLVYSLYSGIRLKQTGASGFLLSLLLFAGFSYPFSVLPFLIGLVFLLALTSCCQSSFAVSVSVVWGKMNQYGWIALTLVCIVVSGFYLKAIYPSYQAYKTWNKIKMTYQMGLYADASESYAPVYPFLSDQIGFLFEYAQTLSRSRQYAESNEVLEKAMQISCDPMLYNVMGKNYQALKDYKQAEACFKKAGHIVPNRIYPQYLLALMYQESGQTAEAKAMAHQVLKKEAKVNSTAVKEMKENMMQLLDELKN